MKFMRLGSKPDAFQTDGSGNRYVLSDLPSDIVVHIEEATFYLHKFPLLSKSSKLQRLVLTAGDGGSNEVFVHDIPGGAQTFEICAKFCYGMVVTLNAYNVAAARCAGEYLEMTEDMEKGNLIHKIEVFLNSGIFRSWKDSIIVLQTTDTLVPWSEELKVVARCINSIASKASIDPCNVTWSYNYNRKSASSDEIVEARKSLQAVPMNWWIEDLCELDVGLYRRVMIAVESRGRVPPGVIREALKAYAARWLPTCYDALIDPVYSPTYKHLVETIIRLLPSDGGVGCSCRFLLELLKVLILIGEGESLQEELVDRIVPMLHKATVRDLLIPSRPPAQTTYDVYLVQTLIGRFTRCAGITVDGIFIGKRGRELSELNLQDESVLRLGKLVDGYLAEIASDLNLQVSSFVGLATSVPEAARTAHDDLYTAIDIFLKVHPDLPKAEKRRITGLMDVKKLSKEARIHAAQNDRLPLRVVIQVLFFEQLRAATATGAANASSRRSVTNPESHWTNKQLAGLKPTDDDCCGDGRSGRSSLSSRSRRMLDKLWAGKGAAEVIGKSSDTSGSSQSPRSSLKPGESRSSGSSSRNRRFSIS